MTATEKEKIITGYMKSLDISRKEAEQLYLDDLNDFIGDEGEQLTTAAKKQQHREKSDKPRNNKPKERKVDGTKKIILEKIAATLQELNAEIIHIQTETEIKFNYQSDAYTIKLTKHRPPKK